MKNYKITVNGKVYEVQVEEVTNSSTVNKINTNSTTSEQVMTKNNREKEGKISITAPIPGKVNSIKTSLGSNVKKGDVLIVLEAMKMENEIVASEDGVIASIDVREGETVESGAVLLTLD